MFVDGAFSVAQKLPVDRASLDKNRDSTPLKTGGFAEYPL
jgi:hypothetical protein